MKNGQVTEVTPTNITKWGDPEPGEYDGQKCWMVQIDFDAHTQFGVFPTTAIVKVANGRIAGWFYKGSGETIP